MEDTGRLEGLHCICYFDCFSSDKTMGIFRKQEGLWTVDF